MFFNKGSKESSIATRKKNWSSKEVMLLVALGSVFGVIYYAFVQLFFVLQILLGPYADLSQHILFGAWLMVAPIALAILKRPLAGVFAELLAALIEVIVLASPFGARVIISALIQGASSESAFTLTRYRKDNLFVFMLSGFFGGLFPFFYSALINDWFSTDLFYLRLILQLISGVLIGGLAAKLLTDALIKTGVLDNFIHVEQKNNAS
ncbi:ECF transporter S component [Thorsellia kenyensis]|uniref:ECF transporter S component n=1 Tax=Thorsellia kenyensis TaxID=1549888 RepID=A0ABV6C9Z7_9GAMM